MAFDRDGFIQAAKDEGWSREEINTALAKQGEKPTPPWILNSPALPIGAAVLGGGAGMLAGPGGIPVGAALSYGGIDVARRALIDLLGYKSSTSHTLENPPPDVGSAAVELGKGPVIAGLSAYPATALSKYLIGAAPGASWLGGKLLERYTKKAGVVPEFLDKMISPSQKVPEGVLRGIPSGQQARAGEDFARDNILALSTKGGSIKGNPPYTNLLEERTNLYGQGIKSFIQNLFNPVTPQQRAASNLGREYSNVIHEAIPQSKLVDEVLSAGHTGRKVLGIGGGIAGLIKLLVDKGKGAVVNNFVDSSTP